MKAYRPPFQYPDPKFRPGQWVKFEGQVYEVVAGTHTHAQLAGLKFAIANWRLTKCASRATAGTNKCAS